MSLICEVPSWSSKTIVRVVCVSFLNQCGNNCGNGSETRQVGLLVIDECMLGLITEDHLNDILDMLGISNVDVGRKRTTFQRSLTKYKYMYLYMYTDITVCSRTEDDLTCRQGVTPPLKLKLVGARLQWPECFPSFSMFSVYVYSG